MRQITSRLRAAIATVMIMTLGHALGQSPTASRAEQVRSTSAIPTILKLYETHSIVAMPEGHGLKDVNDFIFALIRTPTFTRYVNDIVVECGNSRYQELLDRYISGQDVAFEEVQQVWRSTTQPMCGTSGFFEAFFPLVRAINRGLPEARRLRVLAADPPIDWDIVKSASDVDAFMAKRDSNIASVVETNVIGHRRKALMLFGTFHLFHGADDAVSMIENSNGSSIFVIADLQDYEAAVTDLSKSVFRDTTAPALILTKTSGLGRLGLRSFMPGWVMLDRQCEVHTAFPPKLDRPMSAMVDAFLYLGPQSVRLEEKAPADIALDSAYADELKRRERVSGMPPAHWPERIVAHAAEAVFPPPPDAESIRAMCMTRKGNPQQAK